jgi:steroid delta-isomerase-like uncharacterized protein
MRYSPQRRIDEMLTQEMVSRTRERVATWNRHDPEAYAAYYSQDATVHDPMYPEPLKGRDAVSKDFESFLISFPDTEFRLGTIVASDDTVAFEVVASGTHKGDIPGPGGPIPATNRTMEMRIAAFARLDDQGQVVDERRYFDVAGLFQQLGLMDG